jgi:hypothetical protein
MVGESKLMFNVGDIVKYRYERYYIRYGYVIDVNQQEQEFKVQWFDGETLWYLPGSLMKVRLK